MKKKISVVIPTYNEEGNVKPLAESIVAVMETELPEYRYEILFIDNHSKDRTRMYLRELCAKNKNIKAIFNVRNFGQLRSPVYGLKQATGDCVIRMCADFQDPVDMIVKFVREWEKGSKIVIGIKKASKENRMMYWIRGCYYKLIRKITDIDHIEQFTGFGLYDKAFVDVVRDLHDPMPYLRGIIAELGFDYTAIPYEQQKRKAGKSKNNFYSLYDYAMIGITFVFESGSPDGDVSWIFCGRCQCGGRDYLFYPENAVLGSIYRRHGTVTHRNVLSGSNAAVFHRSAGRICAEY